MHRLPKTSADVEECRRLAPMIDDKFFEENEPASLDADSQDWTPDPIYQEVTQRKASRKKTEKPTPPSEVTFIENPLQLSTLEVRDAQNLSDELDLEENFDESD